MSGPTVIGLATVTTRHRIGTGLAGLSTAQWLETFTHIGQHVPRVSRIVSLITFTLKQSFIEYPDGQTPGE